MIRACLDVNLLVLVSGFPASSGVPAELIQRWLRREFELILSEHILSEAVEAWEQPYWATRYTAEQVHNTAALIAALERERLDAILARLAEDVAIVHPLAPDGNNDPTHIDRFAGRRAAARYART